MSEAPLLLPREGGAIAVGVAALVAGLLLGHGTPTFSHLPTVEKAELEVAKNVHELLPDSFRIEATVKKTGLTLLQSEDILLLGGERSDAACSGGAFYLYWEDGAFGMGCQCNGPGAAGCPGPSAACSDPSISGASKFEPNVEYTVVAEYSRKTQIATIVVDGELYLSKHVHWMPPRSGPVTLLAGSHSSADTEPFFGEARNIGVWPVPAGSWGWDMIGVVMGLIGVYIGLGAAVGRRTYQRTGSLLEVHPHASHWSTLSGMVADGFDWTRRGGQSMHRRKEGYAALDVAGGSAEERIHATGRPAGSPRQRKERERKQKGKVDEKLVDVTVGSRQEPVSGESCFNSTDANAVIASSGADEAVEALPAQTAPARGVLSSGARETGATVIY